MGLTDIFLLLILISLVGALIFFISTIINIFRKGDSSGLDLRKTLIFLALALLFFILFGLSL